jgi:hypothetical protein
VAQDGVRPITRATGGFNALNADISKDWFGWCFWFPSVEDTDKHQWHQQHRSTPAPLHKGTTCLTLLRQLRDWWDSIASPVMAGLNAPWNDARNQMFESLGQAGSLGSAGAGMSGAAGAALGEFESNRANQMGLQAWNMMQPGL